VAEDAGSGRGFLRRAAERARQAADALRDEYRKGKEGDDSPVQPIAPTAVDVIKAWMARPTDEEGAAPTDTGIDTGTSTSTSTEEEQAASQVASLLGGVQWSRVSDAVRDNAATQRMRELADQVDWAAAKPVAARVASVLIAAAAAGELGGLHGATGRYVARTIANEMGLAEKVAQRLTDQRNVRNQQLVDYIETTATDASGASDRTSGFEARLAELGQLGPGTDR